MRLRFRAKQSTSKLESRFIFLWQMEKYLEAGLADWRLFRHGPDQIMMENVERLVQAFGP